MSLAVDTNILVDLVGGTERAVQQSQALLVKHATHHGLVICPVVYAELHAHPGWGEREISAFLNGTSIGVDWHLPASVWTAASVAWGAYASRRRAQPGGAPRRLLADFVIGAHALAIGGLMTSDKGFFKTNFPELRVIDT